MSTPLFRFHLSGTSKMNASVPQVVVLMAAFLQMVSGVWAAEPTDDAARRPVPDQANQAKALAEVKELFRPYPALKPAERAEIARKMIAQAEQTKDDPAARFVLLREAKDLASAAGDYGLAFKAIDEQAQSFTVDAVEQKLVLLQRLRLGSIVPAALPEVVRACWAVSDQAERVGNLDGAVRAATAARAAANASRDRSLAPQAEARLSDLRATQQELPRVKAAEQKLAKQPDDPEANLLVGRFNCIAKGDWEHGLPLLAKGSDAALKVLAARELAKPAAAEEQFAVAGAWWDVGEKEKAGGRQRCRAHASAWYQKSLPGLSGLHQALAEKRIEQAEANGNAGEAAALSRMLGDLNEWTVKGGKWERTRDGRIRGTGDCMLQFNHDLPADCSVTCRINVVSGMRPRIAFGGTGIVFANEGYAKNLAAYGAPEKSGAFAYENNQPRVLRFAFAADHFEFDVDGKRIAEGTRKVPKSMSLTLQGGDGFSPGTTEFWDFAIDFRSRLGSPAGTAK
jgi:hypothetical protein